MQDVNSYDIALAGHFGTPICTTENIDVSALFSDNEYTESQFNSIMPMAAGDLTLVASAKSGFSGTNINGYGQELTVYYSSRLERIAVCTKSFSTTVQKYFEQDIGPLESISTGVDRFSIELKRNSFQAPSYIVGIDQDPNIPAENAYNLHQAVREVFYVSFDFLGWPSSLLDGFFTGIIPSRTISPDTTSNTKVSYSTSMGSFNFSQKGALIVFQMSTAQTSKDQYTATISVRYKVYHMEVSGNMITYFVNAADASRTFYVTLTK